MAFALFLLVNFMLLVRPNEVVPGMLGWNLYEACILSCMAVATPQILTYLTGRSLDTQPITLCMFGLFVAVVLSNLTQFNMELLGETVIQFGKILVYYLLLVSLLTTPARIRTFMVWMTICIASMVLLSVLRYHDVLETPVVENAVAADFLTAKATPAVGLNAAVTDEVIDRATGEKTLVKRLCGTGIFNDPNDLASMIVVGICLCLYWLVEKNQGAYRVGAMVCMGIFLYALYSTYSRGGFLCLVAGLAVLFKARFGWRKSLLLGALVMPVLLVFFGGRMTSLETSEGTSQSRIQIWSDGMMLFREAPLFGVGMGKFGTTIGKAAHNSFLECYAELGMFGGTLFVGAFYFAFLTLWRLGSGQLVFAHPELKRLQPFLLAVITAYCVGMMSLSRSFIVPTYMVLGLITAYLNVAACYSPVSVLRFDMRLAQRLAVVSVAFMAMSYVFVRVLRV